MADDERDKPDPLKDFTRFLKSSQEWTLDRLFGPGDSQYKPKETLPPPALPAPSSVEPDRIHELEQQLAEAYREFEQFRQEAHLLANKHEQDLAEVNNAYEKFRQDSEKELSQSIKRQEKAETNAKKYSNEVRQLKRSQKKLLQQIEDLEYALKQAQQEVIVRPLPESVPNWLPQWLVLGEAAAMRHQEPFQEVRKLVHDTEDLQLLYERLGYSLELEWEFEQHLNELKALIHTEIPDFAAFRKALKEVQEQLNQEESEVYSPEVWKHARFQRSNDDLLQQIIGAGDNKEAVLDLLNRNAVEEPLPFVEQLPFYRGGKVIWRTPIELSILRRCPKDPQRFAKLLDDLESRIKTSRLSRTEQSRKDALEALDRLRRDCRRENAYIPTPLKLLDSKLNEWLLHGNNWQDHQHKEKLDTLLLELIYVRRDCQWDQIDSRTFDASEARLVRNLTRKHAKTYLDAEWMHIPWLTTFVLTNLLDGELTSFSSEEPQGGSASIYVLKLVRDEIASGYYDNNETIRHLRTEEKKGLYIHSLIFALLRLHLTTHVKQQREQMINELAAAIEQGDFF